MRGQLHGMSHHVWESLGLLFLCKIFVRMDLDLVDQNLLELSIAHFESHSNEARDLCKVCRNSTRLAIRSKRLTREVEE